MFNLTLTLMAWVIAYCGFALLALSQERHWNKVLPMAGAACLPVARLRVAGAVLLFAALLCCLRGQGAGFGSVLWVMLMWAAALTVAFTLAWWPSLLLPLAKACCPTQVSGTCQ